MRRWVALAPLALLVLVPMLTANRFSSAADNSSTRSSDGTQTPLPTSSPACTDLAKVQGSVIEFGFEGRFPYSVEIDNKGDITTKGARDLKQLPPVPLPFGFERDNISPSTVKALIRLASASGFWSLPKIIGTDSSSDTPEIFVAVNLSCTSHRVTVRDNVKTGSDVHQFAEMYMLLSDLVYNERVGYKPLQ